MPVHALPGLCRRLDDSVFFMTVRRVISPIFAKICIRKNLRTEAVARRVPIILEEQINKRDAEQMSASVRNAQDCHELTTEHTAEIGGD